MHKRRYDKEWNFKEGKMNDLNHLLHPYPAMMMPLIARSILNTFSNGRDSVVLDPYVGSGTTIIESMKFGVKEVHGFDLNPLAVLISIAKSINYDRSYIKKKIKEFETLAESIDYKVNLETTNILNFSIRDSWFTKKNIIELGYIKKYIDTIQDHNTNIFFKVTFSEIVRKVSFTRNGEFKLYRIPKNKVESHNPEALIEMILLLKNNLTLMEKAHKELNYDTKVFISNENSTLALKDPKYYEKFDLVITSPPYGDSRTTVAYGQFSRLANEWLEFDSPQLVDSNLMGGRNKVDSNYVFHIDELDRAISKIKQCDNDYKSKRHPDVISFYIDYLNSIETVSKTVKKDGVVVYVVGNRRVRNIELPTDIVTARAFEKHGFKHIETIVRDILNKRMPSKASPKNEKGEQVSTMMHEYIVILKKVD